VLAQATLLEVCDLLKLLPVTDHKICLEKIAYARLITDGSGFNRFFSVLKDDASREFVLEALKDSWATIASSTKDLMLILTLLSHEQQAVVLQGIDWENFNAGIDLINLFSFWKALSTHKAAQDSFFEKMKERVCQTRSVVFLCDVLFCMTGEQVNRVCSYLLMKKKIDQLITSLHQILYFEAFLDDHFPEEKEPVLKQLENALLEHSYPEDLYQAWLDEKKRRLIPSFPKTKDREAFVSTHQFPQFYKECVSFLIENTLDLMQNITVWKEEIRKKTHLLSTNERGMILSIQDYFKSTMLMYLAKSDPDLTLYLLTDLTPNQKYALLRIQNKNNDTLIMLLLQTYQTKFFANLLADLTTDQKYALLCIENKEGTDTLTMVVQYYPFYLKTINHTLTADQKYDLFCIQNEQGITALMTVANVHPKFLPEILKGLSTDQTYKLLTLQADNKATALMTVAKMHPKFLPEILKGLSTDQTYKLLTLQADNKATALMTVAKEYPKVLPEIMNGLSVDQRDQLIKMIQHAKPKLADKILNTLTRETTPSSCTI
jgi:hypothetical protein